MNLKDFWKDLKSDVRTVRDMMRDAKQTRQDMKDPNYDWEN
jgi:hypothetical protein